MHVRWGFDAAQGYHGDDSPRQTKRQCQPQGAHFPDVRNGKARNITARHANTYGINRPVPAQRRAGTVTANVMHNGDDKGIEEQRIGQAADPVEQQN
ncbi:Uncharacterised protein [Enterobacter hormaechei]|nr:Uncharacterised protein [Enterobacter hormaechei]